MLPHLKPQTRVSHLTPAVGCNILGKLDRQEGVGGVGRALSILLRAYIELPCRETGGLELGLDSYSGCTASLPTSGLTHRPRGLAPSGPGPPSASPLHSPLVSAGPSWKKLPSLKPGGGGDGGVGLANCPPTPLSRALWASRHLMLDTF